MVKYIEINLIISQNILIVGDGQHGGVLGVTMMVI